MTGCFIKRPQTLSGAFYLILICAFCTKFRKICNIHQSLAKIKSAITSSNLDIKMTPIPKRLLLATPLLIALALAACGGDSGSDSTLPTPTPTGAPTSTPTPNPDIDPTPTPTSTPTPTPIPAEVNAAALVFSASMGKFDDPSNKAVVIFGTGPIDLDFKPTEVELSYGIVGNRRPIRCITVLVVINSQARCLMTLRPMTTATAVGRGMWATRVSTTLLKIVAVLPSRVFMRLNHRSMPWLSTA